MKEQYDYLNKLWAKIRDNAHEVEGTVRHITEEFLNDLAVAALNSYLLVN